MVLIDHSVLQVINIYNVIVFISSYDSYEGFNLHLVEPSGHVYAYHGYSHGKGRQICKSEIEKRAFRNMTCKEALPYLSKM